MIDLYSFSTPNGFKVSIMLEEVGLAYNPITVSLPDGEQKKPDFLQINPNGKIPAIVDQENGEKLFESGAILVYLAEKSGKLLPKDGQERADVMEWLMWQMSGLGPWCGQMFFYYYMAPESVPFAAKKAHGEVERLLGVLNTQLNGKEYITGTYSIADIACYPWIAMMSELFPELAEAYPEVKRWCAGLAARPAVQKGMSVPMPPAFARFKDKPRLVA